MQVWLVAGAGVEAVGQSKVMLQDRVCLPVEEQMPQLVQVQVSSVQEGEDGVLGAGGALGAGGVHDWLVSGLAGVSTLGQSKLLVQIRVCVPSAEQVFHVLHVHSSCVHDSTVIVGRLSEPPGEYVEQANNPLLFVSVVSSFIFLTTSP